MAIILVDVITTIKPIVAVGFMLRLPLQCLLVLVLRIQSIFPSQRKTSHILKDRNPRTPTQVRGVHFHTCKIPKTV